MKKRIITRPVIILSLVSLFTDISSEMLYPVMPVFLKSIGFSVLLISVLEGLAEITAGLSKGYFGQLSDNTGRRLPFIRLGYFLSAVSKPMMALFTYPWWIFLARTADRFGKGLRTGARDAYLSDCTVPEHKGKVFGFHRALDTLGAFLGPIVALIFLYFYPGEYRWLFILAAIPGIISISFTFAVKENAKPVQGTPLKTSFTGFLKFLKTSNREYKLLLGGLLAFALFNSSDMLLLLRMKEAGLTDTQLIFVYIFYNLIYAVFAYPLGTLGDKIGLKKTYAGGLILFSLVYAGMVIPAGIYFYLALFFIYGVYTAATESISKAWITNIVDKNQAATAIGTYASFNSILALVASTIAGLIWMLAGLQYTFAITASATFLIAIYVLIFVPYRKNHV